MKNKLSRIFCVLLAIPILFVSSVSAASSAQSDTTGNFTVPQGKTYTFKITSSSKPSLAAGSKSFQYVSTKQSGSNYFIKFSAVGKPGDGCGFYLDSGKRPVAIASILANVPRSDTTGNFTVTQGKTYTFKITSSSEPSFAAGSKSFQYVSTKQSGSNYFIKFSAVGKPGDGCGFYLDSGKRPVAIAKITAGTPHSDTTGLVKVKKGQTYQFMITYTSVPKFTIGSPSFRLVGSTHSGNRYFYKVKAVGKVGQASGIYLENPKTPVAVLKVI